jgi:hypothetical protein
MSAFWRGYVSRCYGTGVSELYSFVRLGIKCTPTPYSFIIRKLGRVNNDVTYMIVENYSVLGYNDILFKLKNTNMLYTF